MPRNNRSSSEPVRRVAGAAAVLVLLTAVVAGWVGSRLGEYSVTGMGHLVTGVDGDDPRLAAEHAGHHRGAASRAVGSPGASVDVTSLVADPTRPADVHVELVARKETVQVAGGRPVPGYTVNGTSPGPTIRAVEGDLVEVTLVNESVADGATLHWHGVDVPNAADGVAGVTQDAVPVGGRHTYRFVVGDAGTYWYHSHQMSHEQVEQGLLGALVVEPRPGPTEEVDVLALLHVYGGQHTVGGSVSDPPVVSPPGASVRVRVVNTDQGTAAVWASVPFRVAATDGHEVSGPTEVTGSKVLVPAGGRVDVVLTGPASGAARVHVGGARSILVGPGAGRAGGADPPVRQPAATLDLLGYGTPSDPGFGATRPDRSFDYVIGRRLGVLDGRPGVFWTINGHMFPDVPMFHVRLGDVVRFHVENRSGDVHPMHLHGHHVVVLSRDGVASTGSPWVVDSLDVRPGEQYEVAFVADNPGIWSDHCHTLAHAVDGLIAHLMYEGVTTPFTINGRKANHPE